MIWGVQKNYRYTLIQKFEFLKKWFGLQDKNWVKFTNFNLVCDTNSAFQMYVLISSVIVESSHKKTKQPTQNENAQNKRKHAQNKRKHTQNKRKHTQNKRKRTKNKRKHTQNKRKHTQN